MNEKTCDHDEARKKIKTGPKEIGDWEISLAFFQTADNLDVYSRR